MSKTIAFPLVKGAEGLLTPRSGTDLVWSKFIYAFLCPKGTRVMNRTFGSNLYKLLFNPADELLAADIAAEAKLVQKTYVPEMTILKINVVFTSTEVQVSIYFSAQTQSTTKTVSVPLA